MVRRTRGNTYTLCLYKGCTGEMSKYLRDLLVGITPVNYAYGNIKLFDSVYIIVKTTRIKIGK